MVHPGLKSSEPALQKEQHFNQLPQRNLDAIKEHHSERERVPANVSLVKLVWTALAASFFLIKSGLHR